MRTHPPDTWIRKASKYPRKGSDRVLGHIEQCARCKERLSVFTTAGRFGRSAEKIDYGPVIERSYQVLEQRQAALARERNDAPRLLARLMGLTPERQQLLLSNSRRFQTWGLLELLLQYGEDETFVNPVHAEEIFRLALDVSTYLDSSFYGRERVEDIRARVWGYLGNAHRAQGDLASSEEAFGEAFLVLRRGSDDVMERAMLFDFQASLRRYQDRFDESVRLSSQAIAIYKRMGEDHLSGKSLVKLSIAHSRMGDVNKAIAILCRSFHLFSPMREPRLALGAMHNLANHLAVAGRFLEAQKVLARARPLYRWFPEPRWQSRRRSVEARIAWGLGRYQEAEALMKAARDGFLPVNASYDGEVASREFASIRARPYAGS